MVIWTLFSDDASTTKQIGIGLWVRSFVFRTSEGDLQFEGKCSWCSQTSHCYIEVFAVLRFVIRK